MRFVLKSISGKFAYHEWLHFEFAMQKWFAPLFFLPLCSLSSFSSISIRILRGTVSAAVEFIFRLHKRRLPKFQVCDDELPLIHILCCASLFGISFSHRKQKTLIRFCQKWNSFAFHSLCARFVLSSFFLVFGIRCCLSVSTESTYYLFDKIIFYSISNSGILFWIRHGVTCCRTETGTRCILEPHAHFDSKLHRNIGMRDNRVYWIILFRKRAKTNAWVIYRRVKQMENKKHQFTMWLSTHCFSALGFFLGAFRWFAIHSRFRSFIHIPGQLEFQASTIDFALVIAADDCLFEAFFSRFKTNQCEFLFVCAKFTECSETTSFDEFMK